MMSYLWVLDYYTGQDIQISEIHADAMPLIIVPVVGASPNQPCLQAVCKM